MAAEGKSERRTSILALCAEDGAIASALAPLEAEGFALEVVPSVYRAVADFARKATDMVVADLDQLAASELECVRVFREISREAFILAVFSAANRHQAAEAMRLGADGGVLQPFYPVELAGLLRRWAERLAGDRSAANDQRQHLDSLALLAKGTAHEINNPLTMLSGWLQMMAAEEQRDAQERQRLTSMKEEAERIGKVVERLLAFGEEVPPERAPVELNELVSGLLDELRQHNNGIEIDASLAAKGAFVLANAARLRQACRMMLEDAAAAVDGRGRIRVRTELTADGACELSVHDEGRRLPPEALDRAFEPYRLTPRVGESMSLAYPAIYGIMRSHGGEVTLTSNEADGTEFRVRLPVV